MIDGLDSRLKYFTTVLTFKAVYVDAGGGDCGTWHRIEYLRPPSADAQDDFHDAPNDDIPLLSWGPIPGALSSTMVCLRAEVYDGPQCPHRVAINGCPVCVQD